MKKILLPVIISILLLLIGWYFITSGALSDDQNLETRRQTSQLNSQVNPEDSDNKQESQSQTSEQKQVKNRDQQGDKKQEQKITKEDDKQVNTDEEQEDKQEQQESNDTPQIVAKNLEIPWDIAFLPDGDMLVTERPGRLLRIDQNGNKTTIAPKENQENGLSDVAHVGEGGLLGVVLHPNFEDNNIIYLYQTTQTGGGLTNKVEQYKLVNNQLTKDEETTTILENIPGAIYHDGGRMKFGPDGKLYITVGDATNKSWAQINKSEDNKRLAGSILRLNPDGSIPADNPFGNEVYSYGHRNPQGITWSDSGIMYSSEHGPSGGSWPNCCQDELNLIEAGGNYGWPDSVGNQVQEGTIAPLAHSGRDTWAPASALYWNGSVFFTGLRGETLYEAVIKNREVSEVKKHLEGRFGRLRTLKLGPNGDFYLTTSNRDGRGTPVSADDRIIKIDPL